MSHLRRDRAQLRGSEALKAGVHRHINCSSVGVFFRLAILTIALVAASAPASAQPLPFLVKDINTATDSAGPYQITRVNDFVFFVACEPAAGCEIWKSDGTSVSRVSDLQEAAYDFEITDLTAVGDLLFFRACDAPHGCEIWKSDGVTTSIVADIKPGPTSSGPDGIRAVGGKLFFRACDAENGCVLRATDGVTIDLIGGTPWLGVDYDADDLAVMNGSLFYPACDATHGCEIWRNDGSGPVLVADIATGPAGSDPYPNRHHLTVAGNNVYFTACTETSGCELWKTDAVTTTLVADIEPGNASSDPFGLTSVGDTLFFYTWGPSAYRLWKTDGVSVTPLEDFAPGTYVGVPRELTDVGGRLLFFVCREPGTCELWTSDGVTTTAIADVPTSTDLHDLFGSWPTSLAAIGGTLFFRACDEAHGCELWKSDGVTTALALDILPGGASSFPWALTNVNGTLFLTAFDAHAGRELMTFDGVATTVVADINTSPLSSFPSSLTAGGDVVYFRATDPVAGTQLWKSDGTNAGTTRVGDDFPNTDAPTPCELTMAGDTLFFTEYSPTVPRGSALWKSNGTGTSFVAEIHPDPPCSSSAEPTALGDILFFRKCVPTNTFGWPRCSLWKTDGVTTSLVADVMPANLTATDSALFFTAPPISGVLWKTDGVTAGPVQADGIQYAQNLTAVGDTLFFVAYEPETGQEIWKTDGVTASIVADLVPGHDPDWGSSRPGELTAAAGTLFFSAYQPATGDELWKTDGVTMTLVADIEPGAGSSSPSQITAVGAAVVFVACDTAHGCELWRSDGSSTTLLADLAPGSASAAFYELTVAGGMLYFRVCTEAYGCELMKSDGVVIDVFSGGVWPPAVTNVGGTLFFSAFDNIHGQELWAIPATCGNAQPDPGEECDDGNLTGGDGCDSSCRLEGQLAPTPTPAGTPIPTPSPLCPAAPIAGCHTPGVGQNGFLHLEHGRTDQRDKLEWKWSRRAVATNADFGDPLASDGHGHALCIYDGTSGLILDAAIPAGGTCGDATNPRPCWKKTPHEYRYTNASAAPDGITSVTLSDRPRTGKANLAVSGKGPLLDDATFPLAQPVIVQLHGAGSVCWEATYRAPAIKNGALRFTDKAD